MVIVRLASARESLPGCPLLTDAPVYSLAQQVGVTVVARVLLDHVNQELSQGDWLAGAVVSDEAKVGVAHELLGEGDLLTPCRPRFLHNRQLGHGTVEITVRLGLGLVALRHVPAGEPPTEPPAFNLGHMPHQTKQ